MVRVWLPPMDLVETADHYVLRADLPGLSDGDVNVQLEDSVLTISGERNAEHEHQQEGYYRLERAFSRSLTRRRPRQRPSPLRPRRARDPHPQARTEEAHDRPDHPRCQPRHQDDREPRFSAEQPRPSGRDLRAGRTAIAGSSSNAMRGPRIGGRGARTAQPARRPHGAARGGDVIPRTTNIDRLQLLRPSPSPTSLQGGTRVLVSGRSLTRSRRRSREMAALPPKIWAGRAPTSAADDPSQ
jgi:hypothetical protein